MKKQPRTYVGILDGSGNVWGVRIPDIDGCVGGGATPEAAISDVTQALRHVLTHRQSSRMPFPEASPVAAILQRNDTAGMINSVPVTELCMRSGDDAVT